MPLRWPLRPAGLKLLALAVLASALPTRTGRADCPPTCIGALCGSAGTTVIGGHVEPAPGAGESPRLVVESVLRLASGATAPQAGDRLFAWSLARVSSGAAVGYYQGAHQEIPMGLFPVGGDGRISCGGGLAGGSPPAGHGATPVELAAAVGTSDCSTTLLSLGYGASFCDDSSGGPFACAVAPSVADGRAAARPGACATLALLGWAALARRRRASHADVSSR